MIKKEVVRMSLEFRGRSPTNKMRLAISFGRRASLNNNNKGIHL